MKKTITLYDGARRIHLFKVGTADFVGARHFKGIELLGRGEFVVPPATIGDKKAVCRFVAGRAPGEIRLASAPDWLPELTKRVDERLPNDEAKLTVRPPADHRQLDPRFEDGEVRVEDVLIRPDHDEVDDGLVTAIAESPSGPFVPIIVRRTPPEEQPEPGEHKISSTCQAAAR
jgi:hypothetical protein